MPPKAKNDSATVTHPSKQKSTRERLKSFYERLLWRTLPLTLQRRRLERERNYWNEQDEASLIAASLPDNEVVAMPCVWIMEIYLASHIAELPARLRGIGLDREIGSENESMIDIMIQRRVRGGSTSSLALGRLPARDAFGRKVSLGRVHLPPGVTAIVFEAITVIPGVTIIVAQFQFNSNTASIEEPFRTHYRTFVRRDEKRRTWIIVGENQRYDEVQKLRSIRRRRCELWMRDNLPGAFAAMTGEAMPACELLTFTQADPLEGRSPPAGDRTKTTLVGAKPSDATPPTSGSYLELLGQHTSDGGWACVEMTALTLRHPNDRRINTTDDHLVLSTRLADFRFYNEKDGTSEAVMRGAQSLALNFSVFALARLTLMYEKAVAHLQDRLGTVHLRQTKKAVTELEDIQQELSGVTRDARPFFNGILVSNEGWRNNLYTFLPMWEWLRERGENEPLFESIADSLVERSSRVLASEEELRNTIHGIGQLTAATANLWTARIAIYIAIVAALLGALGIEGVPAALLEKLMTLVVAWKSWEI